MMQVSLMNFGDNTRVVNDINNGAIAIGIGAIVKGDIHDVHYNMIRRAISTETLMVVPDDARKTPKLTAIMSLLEGLETEPYDDLLRRFFEVLPAPDMESGAYRPTRQQIRVALGQAARFEVATTLRLQSQVFIREQGDPVTRQEVPKPEPKPAVKEPKADKPAKKSKSKGKKGRDNKSSKPRIRERL